MFFLSVYGPDSSTTQDPCVSFSGNPLSMTHRSYRRSPPNYLNCGLELGGNNTGKVLWSLESYLQRQVRKDNKDNQKASPSHIMNGKEE